MANDNSDLRPVEFKRLGADGLAITWSDGTRQTLSPLILREACPCAACKEARGTLNHEKPLAAVTKKTALNIVTASSDEELRLDKIWPVGNYALGLSWGDGHQTGIYTYQLLFELGNQK